jgi:hypothetical protein
MVLKMRLITVYVTNKFLLVENYSKMDIFFACAFKICYYDQIKKLQKVPKQYIGKNSGKK